MNPSMVFALRGEGSETLELDIYDDIGESWWGEGVTAKSVRRTLKENKNAKTIKLRVNSRGGDVIDGFAIYNLLNEHPARVEADVDALAASMASVILMAADEIRVAANALIMIHNPWGLSMGEAEDLRAHADLLDKMKGQIADAYVARTGIDRAKALEMMDAETWLDANEAKALGFADKIKPSKKGRAASRAFAALNLTGFAAVPQYLLQAVTEARSNAQGEPEIQQRDHSDVASRTADMAGENAMNEEQILKALGVATVADGVARLSALARIESQLGANSSGEALERIQSAQAFAKAIESATGKTGDDAVGLVRAAMTSHTELPKAQARVSELEQAAQAYELDQAVAKAKADKKCVPAVENAVREAFAKGEITLAGAKAWLENSPAIPALENKVEPGPANSGNAQSGADPTWNGKSWNELKPLERQKLMSTDRALYDSMRQSAGV